MPSSLAQKSRSTATHVPVVASRRRLWVLLLVLGWLLQIGIRLTLTHAHTVPSIYKDEAGYLFAARVLTGGPDGDVSHASFYASGYPLLLTPAFWLADDAHTVYRLVLGINAMISATMLPLGYVMLRRLGFASGVSYALGHATALLPAVVFYAQFALADAVLPVVVLGWLLLLHSWLTVAEGASRFACAASLVAAYAYATHLRGEVIVMVHVGLMIIAGVRRWAPRRSVPAALAVTGAGVAAAVLMNAWIRAHTYPYGALDLGGVLRDRLTSGGGQLWTLSGAAGQIWYQVTATWGVAGIGLVVLTAIAVRGGAPRPVRILAVTVVSTTALIAYASSAALPDQHRLGNHLHGRYLACVTPVLFLAGLALLLRVRHRGAAVRAAAVSVLVAALSVGVVRAYAGGRFARFAFLPFEFPEIEFLTWNWTSLEYRQATLISAALLGVPVAVTRVPRYGHALLPAVLIGLNLAAVIAITVHVSQPYARGIEDTATAPARAGLRPGQQAAMDRTLPWQVRLPQDYQVWWTRTRTFDCHHEAPPPEATIAVVPATCPTPPPGWHSALTEGTPPETWTIWTRAHS